MALEEIERRIAAACTDVGRPASSVTLVAVSKFQPPAKIKQLLIAGHRVFGENRVQEAAEKWPELRLEYADITLHLIGHLQTNKVQDAVRLFDVIETVDSERLALALKDEMARQSRNLPCLIQVNTGEEPQKGGVLPQDLENFYRFCTEEARLDIRGLMCIPPEDDIPDLHFALLRKFARALGLQDLSMGMSRDFEVALRYGATHVRVGSALFGERKTDL